MVQQRRWWGRAYRNGKLVCARVHVTIGYDDRLGLSRAERRYLAARFVECVDPALRGELISMVRRRGSAARRIAESLEPLLIVLDDDDPAHGRQRLTARLQPPLLRFGHLREIEFTLRELSRTS